VAGGESIIQIVGTDNIDSIRGTNPIGCVFSEYAIGRSDAWKIVEPVLLENGLGGHPKPASHGHLKTGQ
jgi:hypothetical protein